MRTLILIILNLKDLLAEVYKNSGPGSVFLFDDFAMMPFRKQNEFYSKFLNDKGHEILTLPTGQESFCYSEIICSTRWRN